MFENNFSLNFNNNQMLYLNAKITVFLLSGKFEEAMNLIDLSEDEITSGINGFLDRLSNGLKLFKSYPKAKINIIMNIFDLIIIKLMIFDNENEIEQGINKYIIESFDNKNYHSVEKTAEILIKEFEKDDSTNFFNEL